MSVAARVPDTDELRRMVAAERDSQGLPLTIQAPAALHQLAERIRSVGEPPTSHRRRKVA